MNKVHLYTLINLLNFEPLSQVMYKQFFYFSIIFFSIVSCSPLKKYAHKTNTDYAESITQEELKEQLTIYASDEFAGRNTGTEGAEMAVDFLVGQYQEMNLSSPKDDYTQDVPLIVYKMAESSVTIGESHLQLGKDYLTFDLYADGGIDLSELVYVNYGIEDETYSNYQNIDVQDKVVAMRLDEPMENDSIYLLSGTKERSVWSSWRGANMRTEIAKEKGAKAVLFFVRDTTYKTLQRYFSPSSSSMKLKNSELSNFYNFFISPENWTDILLNYDKNSVFALDEQVKINYKNKVETIVAENVLAHVKGSEYPDEYILITAHLDHVGTNDEGEIYNGADDDGSGTVAILEIAEAFQLAAEQGHTPKRSILFLHVTGEEKGLLGSKYYTDYDPIIPLENTVADLNIDMVGRIDPKREGSREYIYLIGSDKLSTELHQISEQVNAKYTQLELDYKYNAEDDPNRFYYRSDHYNFAKNNIPVIFYFNGTHKDYHQPTDSVEKIEFDLLQKRAQLIFYTAWELANRENRIVVDKEFK